MSPAERAGDVSVLYVGGLPRSGSTLTDLLLDRLPGHVSVGELFYLFRNGVRLDNLCGCGVPFSRCDFWQTVGEAAFGGWSRLDVDRVRSLQARVDRTAAIPAIASPLRASSFSAALGEYRDVMLAVYRAILAVSGERVVIDSSKRPSLAYVLATAPEVRLTCVHVVRDPRGVAYSFGKVVPLRDSSDATPEMPRSRAAKVGRRWVTVNALIRLLQRAGAPTLTVRYEDLATHPVEQLSRVAELEGISAETLDTADISADGLLVRRAHLVAGSRIRLLDGVLPIRLDEEWRAALSPGKRRLVSSMTALSRARYGYLR